jgi:hypothetical protein
MPPLLVFAGTLAGIAMVRWAFRAAERINRELDDVRGAIFVEPSRADIPTLRLDPITGAYRPG